jgi:hypothetical protein
MATLSVRMRWKEMKNVRIAFKILNGEESVPPTYQEIRSYMIFDVKMDDLRRNARFVAGGHTTYTPHAMAYARFVSRESLINSTYPRCPE